MSGFTIGFNAKTIGFAVCIVILVALLLVGAFFLGKRACNKKSDETTPWNPTNYNMLRDKINLIMKSEGIQTVETFSDVPNLLDCVTNNFTLKFDDPKFMSNSNFNYIVKDIIRECKYLMEKRKTDPSIPDPDPGPPVWTDYTIKKFKTMMINHMFNTQTIKPTDTQLDCIVGKIITNFNNPRNMKYLTQEEGLSLLKKLSKDCNYEFIIPSISGSSIIWDDDNLQKLKSRIIELSDDSSISSADQPFFDCVTAKISKSYNDLSLITDNTKFKPLVNQLIKECKESSGHIGGGWTQVDIDQTKSDMKKVLLEKLVKDTTNEQLDCIVNKIVTKFKSRSEIATLGNQGFAVMEAIISECVSLWTPEISKKYKDTISNALSGSGQTISDLQLDCIIEKIKTQYNNPNNIPSLENVVKEIYPKCTGRILNLP